MLIFDEIVTGFRYYLHGAIAAVRRAAGSDDARQGHGERLRGGRARRHARRSWSAAASITPTSACSCCRRRMARNSQGFAAAIATMEFYERHDVIGRAATDGAAAADAVRDAAAAAGIERVTSKAGGDFGCRPGDPVPRSRRPAVAGPPDAVPPGAAVMQACSCRGFARLSGMASRSSQQTAEACRHGRARLSRRRSSADRSTAARRPAVKPVMRRYN